MIDTSTVPKFPLCLALGLPTSAYYRLRKTRLGTHTSRTSHRALSVQEREQALSVLRSPRFVDLSPGQVVPTLLDEGVFICSVRTMYRILAEESEIKERRNQARHPKHKVPELVATAPNQVWSWDITKLKTYTKWHYLYLYVILDIFSRFVVGWMLAHRENARLAKRLIAESTAREGIQPNQLILHSDRGSPMIAQTTSQLLAQLDITPSLNRPHVSNDNPYSESTFKTIKYSPGFPDRFVGMPEGLTHCRELFDYYNYRHRHSSLAYLTPADVHRQNVEPILAKRKVTMDLAYKKNPHRFVTGAPTIPEPPREVWINKPREEPHDTH